MPSTPFNGTKIGLYIGSNLIASAKTHKLNLDMSEIDTTTKDSAGWTEILAGLKSWGVDVDGLVSWDSAYNMEYLTDALINKTLLAVKLQSTTAGDERFYGNVYLTKVEMDASMEDATAYSVSMKGTGALAHETQT